MAARPAAHYTVEACPRPDRLRSGRRRGRLPLLARVILRGPHGARIGHASQPSGNPMRRRSSSGSGSRSSSSLPRHPVSGAVVRSRKLMIISNPKTRSFLTCTGSCQQASRGILGLVPNSRFHRRAWRAQQLRRVFIATSHDSNTRAATPALERSRCECRPTPR